MRKSLGRIMSKQESFKFLDKAKWLISLSFFVVAVVGNSYYTEVAFLYRVLGVVGLIGLGILLMAESRTELRRVVWPTRVETTQTFLIVFISILVLALLLWGLESLLSWLTKLILG
jgi:preprotein translocase subunit SecE